MKKDYIFNRYLAACNKVSSDCSDCTCNLTKKGDGNANEMEMEMEMEEGTKKGCPVHHEHFMNPNILCVDLTHIECNDPIFRFVFHS